MGPMKFLSIFIGVKINLVLWKIYDFKSEQKSSQVHRLELQNKLGSSVVMWIKGGGGVGGGIVGSSSSALRSVTASNTSSGHVRAVFCCCFFFATHSIRTQSRYLNENSKISSLFINLAID